MYCINCGLKNPNSAKFCRECGTKLHNTSNVNNQDITKAPATDTVNITEDTANSNINDENSKEEIIKFTVEKDTIRFMSTELSTCIKVLDSKLTIGFNSRSKLLNKKNEQKTILLNEIEKTEISKATVVSIYDAAFAIIAVITFLISPENFIYSAVLMVLVYFRTKYTCIKIISNNITADIIFDPDNDQTKIERIQKIINNYKEN